VHPGKVIFSQVMEFLPLHVFRHCVDRFNGNYKVKEVSCLDQYYSMAFAQITYRESLRDIEACLRAQHGKLYLMGIRGPVSRNTLANANKGLAHLCGPCALADCHGPHALQQRSVSRRSERDRLRSGRHDYRFMLVPVPLGAFPKDERSDQAPYPIGSSRQYPVLHPHLRWKTPRGQHTGFHSNRGRRFLYHEGLPGLRQTPLSFTVCGLLCHPGQIQLQMPTSLLSSSGSEQWPDMLSIGPDRCKVLRGLSRQATPGKILRLRDQKDSGLSHEQLHFTAFDHLSAIPESLAGRAIFQMDQTKSPNKDFLRHIGECRQDSDMDCCVGLCACGHHEKTAKYSGQSLHNFTGAERLRLRENAAFSTTCTTRLQKPKE
jgi:hypothetical protein